MPSTKLFKHWLPLVDLLKSVSIALTHLFVDFFPAMNVFLFYRVIIDDVSNLLSFRYSITNFNFINQSNGWTLNNGALDFPLSHWDGLHLVEKGNLGLGKTISKV